MNVTDTIKDLECSLRRDGISVRLEFVRHASGVKIHAAHFADKIVATRELKGKGIAVIKE